MRGLTALVVRRGFRAVLSRSAKQAGGVGVTSEVVEYSRVAELPQQDPAADVEVAVSHSDLNYKDGMIVMGHKGVVRDWPIVGGIDYAGHVVRSSSPMWREGDAVVLVGNKAGQYFDGGYAERATCRAEWLVLPTHFNLTQSMAIGTAGVTAAMCVHHLERAGELRPSHGPVLVTGAAGGVGQVAVALLAARGYEVIASTGRQEEHGAALRDLGATQVIDRLEPDPRPLSTQRWAGVVDAVGGSTLTSAIAQTMYRGAVASTGVASGHGMPHATVFPFILRGVRLLGVDSTMPWDVSGYPADPQRWQEWRDERMRLWELLSESLSPSALTQISSGSIGLEEVIDYAPKILNGEVAGRVVVDVTR